MNTCNPTDRLEPIQAVVPSDDEAHNDRHVGVRGLAGCVGDLTPDLYVRIASGVRIGLRPAGPYTPQFP